ncbi:hypothetical protein [Garciella nitratireducens]|uniref:hypothetical protein n=1 Tax=Garciella nitratireducens TaxID=218205 RepID=UPI000DE9F70C|nr:hypothetical protein [Garciella nitratireducens]RBP44126.1 hypothetical protein DFR81_10571 [Garciella nitratireducens]
MRIFDRKFMQYQLAYGTWYKLHTRFFLLVIILVLTIFFTKNFIYLFFIIFLYAYIFLRTYQMFQMSDEKFNKKLEKQFQCYYEQKNEKMINSYAFKLEKIAFAVEIKKMEVKKAIDEIYKIIKDYPKIVKGAKGILLNIYLVGKQEGITDEIPKHLIEHLEKEWKNQDDLNILLDFARMALKLEKYDLVLEILNKTEKEMRFYRFMRNPISRSMYKTAQVAIPYYRMIADIKMGNIEQAKKELLKAMKCSKSKKLEREMKETGEKLGILI